MVKRKKNPPQAQQLNLFEATTEPEPAAPALPEKSEPLALDTLEGVTAYLLSWGERHNYPDLEFPLPERYHDWDTAVIPRGKEKWKFNLANAYSLKWLQSAVEIARYIDEIAEKRAWLMAWGEKHNYPGFGFPFHYPPRNEDSDRRFGRVGHTKEQWEHDTCPPYGHREHYRGEWLEKCIEQVKRYDAGEKIPWFEFRLGEITSHSSEEEE